jgi:hypothetical protein
VVIYPQPGGPTKPYPGTQTGPRKPIWPSIGQGQVYFPVPQGPPPPDGTPTTPTGPDQPTQDSPSGGDAAAVPVPKGPAVTVSGGTICINILPPNAQPPAPLNWAYGQDAWNVLSGYMASRTTITTSAGGGAVSGLAGAADTLGGGHAIDVLQAVAAQFPSS